MLTILYGFIMISDILRLYLRQSQKSTKNTGS